MGIYCIDTLLCIDFSRVVGSVKIVAQMFQEVDHLVDGILTTLFVTGVISRERKVPCLVVQCVVKQFEVLVVNSAGSA